MGEDNPEGMVNFVVPSAGAESDRPKPRKSKARRSWFSILGVIAVGALVFAGFYIGSNRNQPSNTQKTQGSVALSERGLRDIVNAKHLTVYWTGPVAGNKYSLFVPKTGVAIVRYLPNGAGLTNSSATFRLVATYVQKNAFSITQKAGATVGNLGFTNIDGNSVFYVKTRPTNVYVGLKGKDVQIEIFDPGQDQAVALSLFRGQIQKIG